MSDLQLIGVAEFPEVIQGDHLADLISSHVQLQSGDVVVVASKVVAKSEGQVVPLNDSFPAARDELVASQSVRTLRKRDSFTITETPHGFVCADAGLSTSNLPQNHAALLPRDADRTAFKIRERLRATAGLEIAVIVSDSFDRAWRHGTVGIALGSSGIQPLDADHTCTVDELAGAARFVMGKSRKVPVVVVRGIDAALLESKAGDVRSAIICNAAEDLFR